MHASPLFGANKTNVVQLVRPWNAIVDGFVFYESTQYERLDKLMCQQQLSENELDSLWAVVSIYQPYNPDVALLLLKRNSFPQCHIVAKNLLWSLKRVNTRNGRTLIDPSVSSEDLMGNLVSLERIIEKPPYSYANPPRPSGMSGSIGRVVFENVRIPGYYDMATVGAAAGGYEPALPSPEQVTNFYRLLHGGSAVYIVLHQCGRGPEFSFIDVSEPVNGMVLLRSDMERCGGFDHLRTLFLDAVSELGFMPRLSLTQKNTYPGLQVFTDSLSDATSGMTLSDWQWLGQLFERKLGEQDPHALLPLLRSAIEHLSNGAELSPEVLKKADLTYFLWD